MTEKACTCGLVCHGVTCAHCGGAVPVRVEVDILGSLTRSPKAMLGLSNTLHVYPIGDLGEHDLVGTGCPCCPWVERFASSILVIHNSFDGRERKPDA